MDGYDYAPSHTVTYSATMTDKTTGHEYMIQQDTCADDPRNWLDSDDAALWIMDSNNLRREDAPDNLLTLTVREYIDRGHNLHNAVILAARWLNIFYPELFYTVRAGRKNLDRSTWYEYVVAVKGRGADESYLDGIVTEFEQWALGNVWVVVPVGTDEESMGGIYADDEEDAFEEYLAYTH